jgi:primosomal protein N' (replication factor Y)
VLFRSHAAQEPPYTYLIALTVLNRSEQGCQECALALMNGLSGNFRKIGLIPLPKRRDTYRYRILLKGKDLEEMRTAVRNLLDDNPNLRKKDIRIDVNPMNLE